MTGKVLSALGRLFLEQGRYRQAEDFCRRAVRVLEGSLGGNNDHTAEALTNMARLNMYQGRDLEAQMLCRKALGVLENIFDRNHPAVADVLETMAMSKRKAGNTAEAAKLEQRARQIRSDKQLISEPAARLLEQTQRPTARTTIRKSLP
jgi:tetratricopeptide (TPR) repeat protein